MKKTLLTLSLIIGSIAFSFAQGPNFGIKSGINISTLTATSSGQTYATSSTTGYHVGVFADFGMGNVSIQPGVLYSTKGGHDDASSSTTSGGVIYSSHQIENITINYIEIPVNVLYKVPVAGLGKVFIGGGPYMAFGVSGKDDASYNFTSPGGSGSGAGSSNLTFGNGSGDIKNPDYGINFLGGLAFKNNLILSVGYGLGLANLSNSSSTTTKNNVISFSVGFALL